MRTDSSGKRNFSALAIPIKVLRLSQERGSFTTMKQSIS